MKRIGLLLLATVVAAGMAAGCGEPADDNKECVSYFCDSLCGDALDCGLLPASEAASCVPRCAALAIGTGDMECGEIYSPAMGMSCDELANFLGYRSVLDMPRK
jgi:hypothetical protein